MPGGLTDNEKNQDRAIALKYRRDRDNAPKVIASGRGRTAQKIIDVAREHDIYIHDDPDLVEVLSQLDLYDEIPTELYVVISELLAFVYRLNKIS